MQDHADRAGQRCFAGEDALGKAVTVSVMIVGADDKKRKAALATGEATAKRTIYRGGAEVFGLGGEWRLPKTAGAAPLRAIWLLDVPTELTTPTGAARAPARSASPRSERTLT